MRLGRFGCGYIPRANNHDSHHNHDHSNVHFGGTEDMFKTTGNMLKAKSPVVFQGGWAPRFVSMAGIGSIFGAGLVKIMQKLGFVARIIR